MAASSSTERPLRWKNFRGRRRERIDPRAFLDLLGDDPFAALDANPAFQFQKEKDDKGSRVYRAELDLGRGAMEVFIKTYRRPGLVRLFAQRTLTRDGLQRPHHYPVKLVKLLWEPSPSKRAWQAARACAQAGVEAAEPLLFLARGQGWLREEVIVSLGAGPRPAPNARQHFDLHFSPPLTTERLREKRALLAELGALLARVRQSRVDFPDFKLHNLVLVQPPDRPPRFVVIDLSEAVVGRVRPEAVFLERFSPHVLRSPVFTRADRLRLLKAYLAASGDGRHWSELCADIEARARDQGRKIP